MAVKYAILSNNSLHRLPIFRNFTFIASRFVEYRLFFFFVKFTVECTGKAMHFCNMQRHDNRRNFSHLTFVNISYSEKYLRADNSKPEA